MTIHLREIFWRPDILAQLQVNGSVSVTKCDLTLPATQMTCDTRIVDCEACRHNFIEGLVTGSGEKLTWDEYHARKVQHTFPTLKEKAAASAAVDVLWTTETAAVPASAWQTLATPAPPADGWTTDPRKPPAPDPSAWGRK